MASTLLVLSLVIIKVLGSPENEGYSLVRAWGKSANEGASLLNAASEGNLQELKGILDRGVDLEFTNGYDKKTALILASENGHLDIVIQLLDRGADIEAQDIFGLTALHGAAENNLTPMSSKNFWTEEQT